MQVAYGRVQRLDEVLGRVELLEQSQLGEGCRQKRQLVRSQVDLLDILELTNGRIELPELVAVQRERLEAAYQLDVGRYEAELIVRGGEELHREQPAD